MDSLTNDIVLNAQSSTYGVPLYLLEERKRERKRLAIQTFMVVV